MVTLTRIYMLVEPYQTLVREIATPTIPTFVTACLQFFNSLITDQGLPVNAAAVEAVCDVFSNLTPLYATTFRPFSSKIRTALGPLLVPSSSSAGYVVESLQTASRRTVISLHHVVAKSGGSEEWSRLLGRLLDNFHATADQCFRAVDESWDATSRSAASTVSLDEEPHGGGTPTDEFPPWRGVDAGSERLIKLMDFISECLRYPTKTPVTIPLSALIDAISRLCLIARLLPKTQTWEQALQINAAIGREEKDELWSVMPDIHVGALRLATAMAETLGHDLVPFVPVALDNLVRVVNSGMSISSVRETGYKLLNALLSLAGPGLSKQQVDMLGPLIGACCRDLQEDAGFLKRTDGSAGKSSNRAAKKGGTTSNADLFLQQSAAATFAKISLEPGHRAAAAALLPALLSLLPQHHLKPTQRGILDKTAILTQNRDAMVASVLNPYRDPRGHTYPSILPHLTRQFPHDQAVEVLRTNLRAASMPVGEDVLASLEELEEDREQAQGEAKTSEPIPVTEEEEHRNESEAPPWQATIPTGVQHVEAELPMQSHPFKAVGAGNGAAAESSESLPKRKHVGPEPAPSKRQELEEPGEQDGEVHNSAQSPARHDEDDDADDSDGSVHLAMELESDGGDDDEEGHDAGI